MATKTFTLKAGDRLPYLDLELFEEDGETPIDFTPYEAIDVRIVIAPCVGGRRIVDGRSATSTSPGVFQYRWETGDTLTPGEYSMEVILTLDGLERTVPNNRYDKIVILPRL